MECALLLSYQILHQTCNFGVILSINRLTAIKPVKAYKAGTQTQSPSLMEENILPWLQGSHNAPPVEVEVAEGVNEVGCKLDTFLCIYPLIDVLVSMT